jgi:hypothetical protein
LESKEKSPVKVVLFFSKSAATSEILRLSSMSSEKKLSELRFGASAIMLSIKKSSSISVFSTENMQKHNRKYVTYFFI